MQDLFLAFDYFIREAAQDPLTSPSTARLARRVLQARISSGYDWAARLSFLEGVAAGEGAAVKPGRWWLRGTAGAKEAQKYFGQLNDVWTAKRDSGIYNKAVKTVERYLGGSGEGYQSARGGKSGEDIVNDLLMGISPVTGDKHKPTFYEIGLTLLSPAEREALHEGKLLPSAIGGGLTAKFRQRAVQILRGLPSHAPTETPEGAIRRDIDRPAEIVNPLFRALRESHNPRAEKVREMLKQIAKTKGGVKADIFIEYLDYIKGEARTPTPGGSADPSGTVRDLEKITGRKRSQISAALKEMKQYVIEKGKKNERLKSLIADIMELGGTGRRATEHAACDEVLADWGECEGAYLEALGMDDGEYKAENIRTVDVGGLQFAIAKYPGAAAGAYKHAAPSRVSDRFLGLGLNRRSKVKEGEQLVVVTDIPSAGALFGADGTGKARAGDTVTVVKVSRPGDPLSQARGSGGMVEFRAQIARGDRLDVKLTSSSMKYFGRRR